MRKIEGGGSKNKRDERAVLVRLSITGLGWVARCRKLELLSHVEEVAGRDGPTAGRRRWLAAAALRRAIIDLVGWDWTKELSDGPLAADVEIGGGRIKVSDGTALGGTWASRRRASRRAAKSLSSRLVRQVMIDCGVTKKGEVLARRAWDLIGEIFEGVDASQAWDVAGLVKRLVDSKAAELKLKSRVSGRQSS